MLGRSENGPKQSHKLQYYPTPASRNMIAASLIAVWCIFWEDFSVKSFQELNSEYIIGDRRQITILSKHVVG